jgi:malate dehydrogenase (oxaloacetate-decarboxylating)(NADP+)
VSTDVNEQRKALREAALHFHEFPKPGKLEIQATKPLGNQRDLGLAYSARRGRGLRGDRRRSRRCVGYTSRGNLVAVISNGTAVLGLGAIGALASKPVMEGKAVLFKKFAGIDVHRHRSRRDATRQKFIEVVAALGPPSAASTSRTSSAPDCFEIEERCASG